MQLTELFHYPGLGVMATAAADGSVNTAVYARPHLIDDETLVWGMTEGRTFYNIVQNPHASYLFKTDMPGFSGVRLSLELIRTEEAGETLALIKKAATAVIGPGAAMAVTHAAWFNVVAIRPLI